MKIAIVEDEEMWRELELNYLKEFYKKNMPAIDCYKNGNDFLRENKRYDIILVDVEMPGKDGFDTIRDYKMFYSDTICIILTVHTEISRQGYLVGAFRYIDKIKMEKELKEALISADILIETNNVVEINVVNMGKKEVRVKDIIYIETEKRKILVHTTEGVFVCNDGIETLEKQLTEYGFYRSHRSYLVNLDKVEKFDHRNIYFRKEKVAVLSSRKYVDFKKKYLARNFLIANG